MQNLRKLMKTSAAGLGIMAFVGGAFGATSASPSRATSSVGAAAIRASSQRMPTMPSLPINGVGNMSPDLPTGNKPSTPKPDDPDVPDVPDNPPPAQECPDGGVKDSDYTVEKCMNDVLACVNGGVLPGGISDLFNEDTRNAIVNGMGVCRIQIERCITEVRRNCKNVYNTSADVWIDFNSRKVQPEYYNFVLRKTGLTPNQAKNTCLLLDVNTYGPSFSAVAMNGNTTQEYNKNVGAYNGQNGGTLTKKNPQGVTVNKGAWNTVDGGRGHYARWDAATAECYLRVAAYNKNSHIKNSWLFGAAGDDRLAEVWRAAGTTFTCNKDLFGFSLMNDTSTAAVVGIGGGALVGTGVGAIVGHGKRALDCNNDGHQKKMMEQLRAAGGVNILNEVLVEPISIGKDRVTKTQCEAIAELRDKYDAVNSDIVSCLGYTSTEEVEIKVLAKLKSECFGQVNDDIDEDAAANAMRSCAEKLTFDGLNMAGYDITTCKGKTGDKLVKCLTGAMKIFIKGELNSFMNKKNFQSASECCFNSYIDIFKNRMSLRSVDKCVSATVLQQKIEPLRKVLDSIEIIDGEKSNMGKSIGVGAAIGVGAGGAATAITALIEHSNINCRVGDDLSRVEFGKSYAIETLKDFYVKWNLRLPDTIAPTGMVTDCASWRSACGQFTNANECTGAVLNYRPDAAGKITLVQTPCVMSGSMCIENRPVAKSYGACEE